MERYSLSNFVNDGQETNYHWFSGNSVMHCHDYFELILVTKGIVKHDYLGEKKNLNTKEIVLVKPYIEHDPSSSCTSQHFNISFSSNVFRQECNNINSNLCNYIMNTQSDFRAMLDDTSYNYILSLVKCLLKQEFSSNESIIINIIHQLLFFIFLEYCSESHAKTNNYPEWFSQYLDLISQPENFTKNLSEIYTLSCYSQSAIINYFKLYLNTTPIAYIIKQKLSYACKLLSKTNMTILAISLECGYSSLSRFVTLFKEHYKITPTEYRKKCQSLQLR